MPTTIDIFKFEKDVESYSAGDRIFSAGDEGRTMFVVQDGEVEIRVGGQVIDRHTAGGVFGEMALVDHSPRSADAVARTDCRLVTLDDTKFMQHVHRTPFFALQMMRILTERLRRQMRDAS